LPELSSYCKELEKLFVYGAKGAWDSWARDCYEKKVEDCKIQTDGKYPAFVIERLYLYEQDCPFIDMLIEHLSKRETGDSPYKDVVILNKLRVMFARIRTELLNPDLVIMDEFQRFKFLLNSNQ
jgi:hypothetical protein